MPRRYLSVLSVCLFAGPLLATTDSFSGTWKLNPTKSRLTDQMKVDPAGPNTYTFHLSATNPETILTNGSDQPGIFGTTLAVTVLSPRQWRVVRKKDGRMLISAIWDLSADGKTLTDHFTGFRADGSTNNLLYVHTRTDGASGFAGVWESHTEEVNSVYEIQVEPYGDNGLSFIVPAQKTTRSIRFDGKGYAVQGPNVPAGYVTSGRRRSDRAIELTDKIGGKLLGTRKSILPRVAKPSQSQPIFPA